MDKKIWQILYSFLVLPILFVIVHIISIFSKTVRKGFFPRRYSVTNLENWLLSNKPTGKIALIHAASMGEFEHIKPLIQKLKEDFNTTNVVTFFSPSGYKNVRTTPGMDFFIYMPFDFRYEWRRLYSLLKPQILIISKHDVWANQIWQAKKSGIPIYLVNASLADNSSRTKPVIKRFLKHVYREFTEIYAISEEDKSRFALHYPRCNVKTVGDTKYDQVTLRRKAALTKKLLPDTWLINRWIFLAGSIWPEDETHLIPAFKILLDKFSQLSIILVPHEPTEKHIYTLQIEFEKYGICLYSKKEILKDERIIIVDSIGLLAELYQYAKAAYVGGSFKQGIHNAMEPAIYGIPVMYGPVHENSFEAIQLLKTEGGFKITDSEQAEEILRKFIENEMFRKIYGENALKFASKNTGATEKILANWTNILSEEK